MKTHQPTTTLKADDGASPPHPWPPRQAEAAGRSQSLPYSVAARSRAQPHVTAPRHRRAAISIHAERGQSAGGPPVGRKGLTRAAGWLLLLLFLFFFFFVFLINHPPLRDLNMEMESGSQLFMSLPAAPRRSRPRRARPVKGAGPGATCRPPAAAGPPLRGPGGTNETNERPGGGLRPGLARLRGGRPVSAQHGRRGARCRHQVTLGLRRGLPPARPSSPCLFVR